MWTCVAVTCRDSNWAKALRNELAILHSQNLLKSQSPCIVLEDPLGTVGSGGATLNALLVTVERLCSKTGHTTITADVLTGANILIIHQGRDSCYWPSGKLFLPVQNERCNNSGLQTYLEFIANVCSQLLQQGAPPGVWIASTDSVLYGHLENSINWSNSTPDALLVTLKSARRDAEYCGIVHTDADGVVQKISYDGTVGGSNDLVDIVGGIVYLTTQVAESLLSLSSMPALDCCTYLGSDNGEKAQQLSLYFDLLSPMCSGVERDAFVSGHYSMAYDRNVGSSTLDIKSKVKARSLLWEHLNRFKVRAFTCQGLRHSYWTDRLPLERILLRVPYAGFAKDSKVLHSFVKQPNALLIALNSLIESQLNPEEGKHLVSLTSSIQTASNRELHMEGKAFILGAQLNIDKVPEFRLGHNTCLIGYSIRTEGGELKSGRALFSAADVPTLEVGHPDATVFGLSWSHYLGLKGIRPEDLWEPGIHHRTLMTARLFPLAEDITSWRNLLWLQPITSETSLGQRLESWRANRRYSMEDFARLRDPVSSLNQLRQTAALSICQSIQHWSGSMEPYLRRACAEKWSDDLLRALDRIAARAEDRREASRALAAIADLLGCLAGPDGGLRSGPASNREWFPALNLLEHISVEEGVLALAEQRANWMDTPERLIRAARHYERAVHILIHLTVQSVQRQMVVFPREPGLLHRPAIGHWVEVECPARIDLAGGWSDTPPICYEMGGSVVNVAILVNGRKPIGARARRLNRPELVLVSEGQSEPLVITSLDDLMSYTNPTAPGALLKATLVCAGVVRNDIHQDFAQQLQETLGGGLELQGWSLLPQGSGLGTSSILASALLAAIYTCQGIPFNRSQLIHAVLYIEQLLTTGGGWQDQVGGIMGGSFNRGHSPADTCVQVHVEPLPVTSSMAESLNLLLIHTGKVRLARNLLQNVIRQWYARDESIVACFRSLVDNAAECRQALLQGDLHGLGQSINTYWAQKKLIAPGCEPQFVAQLMDRLSPLVHGQSLTGAGGGGFYFALLKETSDRSQVERMIASMQGAEKMSVYEATLDRTGISVTVDGQSVRIP